MRNAELVQFLRHSFWWKISQILSEHCTNLRCCVGKICDGSYLCFQCKICANEEKQVNIIYLKYNSFNGIFTGIILNL